MRREHPPIPVAVPKVSAHRARRVRLARALKSGVVLIPTAPEVMRNADSNYDFRWDSHFYYLSGFREPEAVLAIVLGRKPRHILFCRDKNLEREMWDGFRFGPAQAAETFAFDDAQGIDRLDAVIPDLMAEAGRIHTPIGVSRAWDERITGWMNAARDRRPHDPPALSLHDVMSIVGEMRKVKDATEIGILAKAGDIASAAHMRAMRFARPGMHEYEVEAEIIHEFMRNGARQPAYGSIVAAGANACVLHYSENSAPIGKGDLLLIDAGCEYQSYAADVTRTFPAGGKFSAAQRDVYEVVLEAQMACIAAVKPGASVGRFRDVAVKVLSQGLIDLKLVNGSLDAVIETARYKQFYMHGAGHWLGLDVHDAGVYKRDGQWVKFEAGNVVTVEPGLYIRPAPGVPRHFWDIGVRIEDDIVVTATGNRNLTTCPKRVADIETLTAA